MANKVTFDLEAKVTSLVEGANDGSDAIRKVATEAVNTQKAVQQSMAGAAMSGDKVIASAAKQAKGISDVQKEYNKLMVAALKAGGAQTAEGAKLIKQADELMNKQRGIAEETHQSAKVQSNALRDLQREYKQLESAALEAGGVQTEAGRILLQQAGEIKDRISDLRAATKAYASDTGDLEASADAFNLISDAVQGGIGAVTALNVNTKNAQELYQRLTSILIINNSVQNAANKLQAESNLRIRATAVATKLYNAAMEMAPKLTIGLSAALAGLGIPVVIAGLYALVQGLDDVDERVKKFAEDIEKQNAENIARELENRKEFLRQLSDVDAEYFDEQESVRKERLAKGEDANNVEFDLLSQSIEKYQNKVKGYQQGYYDYLNLTYEEEKKRIKAFNDYINAAMIERNRIWRDAEKKRKDDATKAWDDEKKRRQKDFDDTMSFIDLVNSMKVIRVPDEQIQVLIKGLYELGKTWDEINYVLTQPIAAFGGGLSTKEAKDALLEFQQTLEDAPVKIEAEVVVREVNTANLNIKGISIPIKLDITQEQADMLSQSINDFIDNGLSALTASLDAAINKQEKYIQGIDKMIAAQESAIDKESELAKQGLANNLSNERKRLAELKKQREDALAQQKKLQERRKAIETAEQASSLITSSANILQSATEVGGPLGVAIGVIGIGALLAAFASAQIKSADAAGQYYTGGYTGDGGKYDVAGTVHKGEFVFDQGNTVTYRDLFDAIHKGDKADIYGSMAELLEGTGVTVPTDEMTGKLQVAHEYRQEQKAGYANKGLDLTNKELAALNEKVERMMKREKEHVVSNADGSQTIKKGNKTITIKKRE